MSKKLNEVPMGTIIPLTTDRISHNNNNRIKYTKLGADAQGHIYRYYKETGWEQLNTFKASNDYDLIYIEGHQISAHNIIWACFYATIRKDCVIHHVNGDIHDNSINNLQMVSRGANVSYFFHNSTGENNDQVGATKYKYSLEDLIGPEFYVSLPKYGLKVSNKGVIRNIKTNHVITPTVNVKYPTNLIVGYRNTTGRHSSISLARLFAEAFMVTPETGSYKVLIRDQSDTLFSPLNYFIYQNDKNK